MRGRRGEEGRETERDGRGRVSVRKTRSKKASGCERDMETYGGNEVVEKGCVNEHSYSD